MTAKKPKETQTGKDTVQKAKLKGKNWYSIIMPPLFGGEVIAETPAREEKEIMGRRIEVGIDELANDPSKFFMKGIFQVYKISDGKALTRLVELDTLRDFISRMVQRRVRRIDTINQATTKDGVEVVVKLVSISIRRINKTMKSSLRKSINGVVDEYIKSRSLDDIVSGIITNGLQVEARKKASLVYPLRGVEVRRLQILKYPENEVAIEQPISA